MGGGGPLGSHDKMPVPGTPPQEFSWHIGDTKDLSNLLSLSSLRFENSNIYMKSPSSPHHPISPPTKKNSPNKTKHIEKNYQNKNREKSSHMIFPS